MYGLWQIRVTTQRRLPHLYVRAIHPGVLPKHPALPDTSWTLTGLAKRKTVIGHCKSFRMAFLVCRLPLPKHWWNSPHWVRLLGNRTKWRWLISLVKGAFQLEKTCDCRITVCVVRFALLVETLASSQTIQKDQNQSVSQILWELHQKYSELDQNYSHSLFIWLIQSSLAYIWNVIHFAWTHMFIRNLKSTGYQWTARHLLPGVFLTGLVNDRHVLTQF